MNIRKLMKEKVSRVSISSKMSIVMTVSIVLILTVFLGVNRYYNSFFVYQKLENASLTYLDSIDRMMENLVDTLDGYSRICFSNAGVQELLDKNSSGQVDFSLQDNVNNYLWELVVNVKQIESIYLYSNNGLVASADRQLESLKPDIILTDICMPDIDGLTFAEKIKGRNPDTKVIAITGYDNFEYAKRGICIGLDGYILKPINEEELTECIVKIKKKILEENRKRNEIETLSIFKREAEEIVKNYYLTKLLESDVPEKIVNSQLMEELALETSPMVWIVVFQWKTNLIAKRTGNEELLDCEMWIVNYCKEKLKKMVWVHGTANRLIILDPEKDIMPETILKQLQEEWKKEFECPLYYGTEVIYNQEKSIHEGYIEAVNQLNIELVNGENKPEDIWRWKQQKKETKQLWDLNELKRLQYCVEAEDLEEVEKVIDSYFLKWKDVTLDDMELLQVQLLNIYFYFYTSFGDRCIDAVAMQYMNFYENVKHAENILELKNAFLIGCQALQEMLRGRETAADSYKLIYSMKQYIKENLDDPDFSLGALAKAYYMNSSYLSRFFKEKVKSSFVEYLTEQRIDKAKQLLQYGNFKIYEVGEKVGIYNANYFGILFKKKVGVTPAEYRKQYEK